jgi:hypothetical protein
VSFSASVEVCLQELRERGGFEHNYAYGGGGGVLGVMRAAGFKDI